MPSSRSIKQLTMSPAAQACQGRRPYGRAWKCSLPRLHLHCHPGRLAINAEDLHKCATPVPSLVPSSPSQLPRDSHQAVETGVGQVGYRAGPHLAIVCCGHVPLAHPVAVIGVGVVCVSNPFLGREGQRPGAGGWGRAGAPSPQPCPRGSAGDRHWKGCSGAAVLAGLPQDKAGRVPPHQGRPDGGA